ncbi:SprT-like protein [Natronobacillus azotifigens]|uniref:SprT family protein n=1 Tax=Natronobacillus azotifigens TaxID=472978 RepID=A0A9J6RBR8_9BACI|nr:SprT family protein [Natronobacillus azotifigens]MCZ0702673.1 SprT family protein [Natronobacillus azotifigens]
MNQTDLEQVVNELSTTFFGKPYDDKVVFNNRLRTTGGRYIPSRRTIEINPKYLAEVGFEEMCGIIKHELCHYHLHIEGKGYKHADASFKALLKETGSPRHCQPLPSEARKKYYTYICKVCGHNYSRKRQIDLQKYRCGKCSGRLVKGNSGDG